jgi:hypothetical protein
MEKESIIKRVKSMMESCYAYDGLTKENEYLQKSRKGLTDEEFNEVYAEHKKDLEENYIIKRNVGTDSDGITYNSLVKKDLVD